MVQFSGSLKLNKGSPQGAIVYIKDEDPFTADDLLATAYVDRNGRFTTTWFVNYVDADDVADVYAVFEGNADLARLTTCDPGSTLPIGGTCRNTIPLRIVTPLTPPPPPPPIGGPPSEEPTLVGSEYMKLYYSLDLNRNPKVAIVPSPESYDEVRRYIGSVQEGIRMWESGLEKKYGGTWNIDFEVIQPGALFFQSKPDVVVNLVTHDQDVGCLLEYAGWAKVWQFPQKPVQTQVCTTTFGSPRSSNDVAATAGHEFIHAMGLGHAFNKKGDLMCSVEDGVQTCPSSVTRSNQPSDFNLAATAYLYNSDGFKNPNKRVSYESKFAASDFLGVDSSPSLPTITPIPPSGTITPKPYVDSDNDGIPDSRDKCRVSPETYNGYQDTDGCPDKVPTPLDDLLEKLKDSDGDGILDIHDKCTWEREIFNGYKDFDGCPDSKPVSIDWKTKSINTQKMVNSKIYSLKPGIVTAENSLNEAKFSSSEAQKNVEAAWNSLWWAKKYLGDAELTQKEGENFVSNSKFENAFYKYQYSYKQAEKIDDYLLEITHHLNNAESLESKNKQVDTKQTEPTEEKKTCFLFWCW